MLLTTTYEVTEDETKEDHTNEILFEHECISHRLIDAFEVIIFDINE